MPNTKSAKKYIKLTAKNTSRNNAYKKSFRDAVRKVEDHLKEGEGKEAQKAFKEAQKALDKAAKAGIIKKNTAVRKKSRLSKKIKEAK